MKVEPTAFGQAAQARGRETHRRCLWEAKKLE